jgi:A/G-specific adenine glycosylase
LKLPGVGPYTAGAVQAFAFNRPIAIIETNIRTVYIHHFFTNDTDVSDAALVRLIESTLDTENPREWYWALMDYGSFLKKEHKSLNSKSKHYTKQSTFSGSDRQIRGAIVRTLAEAERPLSRMVLLKKLSYFEDIRVDSQLEKLEKEGMVTKTKQSYHLPV